VHCWRTTRRMNGSRSSGAGAFADPIHGRIYQAITRRVEAGQLADAVTLKAEFEHSGILEEVGGTPIWHSFSPRWSASSMPASMAAPFTMPGCAGN